MSDSELPSKTCCVCSRTIQWRKKWERNWAEVKYCSQACRRAARRGVDQRAEQAILDRLASRRRGASICPSEVARELYGEAWREHMESVRSAARRLVAQGRLEITQRGQVVDPSTAKGPIRLRLPG